MENQYIAGTCNIGTSEKRLRRRVAFLFLILSAILGVAIFALVQNPLVRIALSPLIFLTALNFLQSRHSFCVKFGIFKQYNFGEDIGVTAAIVDKESIKKDRFKSIEIIVYSIVITEIVIGVLLFL